MSQDCHLHPTISCFGFYLPPAGYDLQATVWGDGADVPTSATDQLFLGIDNANLLHIRMFDTHGNRVMDTDETKLPSSKAAAIADLKGHIPGLLPPQVPSAADKARAVLAARAILDQVPPFFEAAAGPLSARVRVNSIHAVRLLPVYTGNASLFVQRVFRAWNGESTIPVYTGNLAHSITCLQSSTAIGRIPIYAASSSLRCKPVLDDAEGVRSIPVYTGQCSEEIVCRLLSMGIGRVPVYTAVSSLSCSPASATSGGMVTIPVYTGQSTISVNHLLPLSAGVNTYRVLVYRTILLVTPSSHATLFVVSSTTI